MPKKGTLFRHPAFWVKLPGFPVGRQLLSHATYSCVNTPVPHPLPEPTQTQGFLDHGEVDFRGKDPQECALDPCLRVSEGGAWLHDNRAGGAPGLTTDHSGGEKEAQRVFSPQTKPPCTLLSPEMKGQVSC